MVSRIAMLAVALSLLVPSVASAQRTPPGGGYDYEFNGCTSQSIKVARGRCDSRRPLPDPWAEPASPRAGSPVELNVDSPGRGLDYAWDTDEDGEFDDGTGESITRTFPAGTRVGACAPRTRMAARASRR